MESKHFISLWNISWITRYTKLHDLDNYKTIYTSFNNEIPWAITGSDTISHKDIKNYCNTGEVISK